MTDVAATAEAGATPAIEQEAPKGRDYEGEARKTGWTPKDEWKGDPEDWKTARQFVEYGELKAGFEKRFAKLEKTNERTVAALKKQHDQEIAALKARRAEIVEKGGKGAAQAVEQIDDRIDALKADAKPEAKEEADTTDEASAVADWNLANPWFGTDEDMTRYAASYAQGLDATDPAEIRAKVDKKMREKFPDYEWGKKPQKTTGANGHAPVDGGGAFGGGGGKADPFAGLPPEARAQAKKDMAAHPDMYPNATAWRKVYES